MVKKNKQKINSYRKGHFAETYVAFWLRLKGYKILHKRYKTPVGEIDLIAVKKNQLIAIEVKARKNEETARYAILEKQWQRITKSLHWYLKENPNYQTYDFRFDAIFLLPFSKIPHFRPIHIQNAWHPHTNL